MQRYLLTLQYLGTRYAGWQTQKNAVAVQQVLEEALRRLCGRRIGVEGAGRTDSGVHAAAQRAHADIPIPIDGRGLILGLNDLLPRDIRIKAAVAVPAGFHCRFDARRKTYTYRIWIGSVADVFLDATHAHVVQDLDVDLMRSASTAVAGHHDFRAFTVANPEVSTTWRTVETISVESAGHVVRISVTADGFLRYMVRRIAGSLIEAGRGKVDPGALARSLEPRFEPARWTAPAHGLTLSQVEYDDPAL